ncbi:MAG: right-handed parallel beta-helix repeat-containing protein [Verrucomicrobia bacterium]|nr:right-handed parallel beta-helix repeat-containing protein [Verrucomicrobiota bacterium]
MNAPAPGLLFVRMTPTRGLAGTSVTLVASGLDPKLTHTVIVNGAAAPITRVTATTVEFTIGSGTTSGSVVLTEGGRPYTYPVPFQILRSVIGRLALPPGIDPAGYEILSGNQLVSPDPGSGQFTTTVPQDRRTVVWAIRGEQDPAFLAVVTPTMNQVVIDAASTALAWAFVSPFIVTRDEAQGQTALSRLASLPEMATVASRIHSASVTGLDYGEDERFARAVAQCVEAYLNLPKPALLARPPSFEPNTPRGTALRYLNPEPNSLAPARRLAVTLSETNAHPRDFVVSLGASPNGNRLDWFAEIYRLDPRPWRAGREQVLQLTPVDDPRKLRNWPMESLAVNAQLTSRNLDLVGLVTGALTDLMFSPLQERYAFNQVLLPKDTPAIYVSQAYSGNVWFGARLLLGPLESQAELLDQLNAGTQWGMTLSANLVIAAVDMVSAFVELNALVDNPRRIHRVLYQIVRDVSKAVSRHAAEPWDADTAYDLIQTAVNATAKGLLTSELDRAPAGITARLGALAGRITRTFVAAINVSRRVSSVGQSLERTGSLIGPQALALERAVIIVGNPFEPEIVSFHPPRGRGGDLVTIEGYNFPTNVSQVKVSFQTFMRSMLPGEPFIPSTNLPARVLASTPRSLVAIVPTNFSAAFPQLSAYIGVQLTNSVTFSSTFYLRDPYRQFYFIPAPELFGMTPEPAPPGGVVTLSGTNFFAGAAENHRVIVDNATEIRADVAGETNLVITLPSSLAEGPHTLSVTLGETATQPLTFTVRRSASNAAGYRDGLKITVTRLDTSNEADGAISLREACLIANGTLGRPIEQHPKCESLPPDDPNFCPSRRRETDWVEGDDSSGGGGGPRSRDVIAVAVELVRARSVFAGPLPVPTSGDTYNLGIVIDGGGATAPGWLLDGVEGVTLSNATLRNFGGHGIHIRNGSVGNKLLSVRVENCGGAGVFLEGSAQNNELLGITVLAARQHGLHLSGDQVRGNFIQVSPTETTNVLGLQQCQGNGIRLEGGAQFNQIQPGSVRSNGLAGILLSGTGTSYNAIGRQEGIISRYYDLYANGGPGIHLADGAQNNVIRYVNPAGNQGDGILLEGSNCASNQVDGVYTGIDYLSEGGAFPWSFKPLPLPNQGSGIHLRGGAHHNLIGSLIPGGFGGRGFIAGDRDDGILLEGPATAYNVVSRKHIGVTWKLLFDSFDFFPVGKNGIHIRDGSHHNVVGATHSWLDVHVLAAREAGILIEGAGSDFNQIYGTQIGAHHEDPRVPPEGGNRVGIHLKDQVRGTLIGLPGEYLSFFHDGEEHEYRFGNTIANSTEAGIRLENCGGLTGTDGALTGANVIQNNRIGEEDFGAIAPCAVGIHLINNAHGNLIGGAEPGLGNRIVHHHTAGILISNVMIKDPLPSNRILNNTITNVGAMKSFVNESALGDVRAGIGIDVVNSGDHVVGQEIATANLLALNWVGVRLTDSEGTHVLGNLIHSNRLAGVVIRGGRSHEIGGTTGSTANEVFGNGRNGVEQGGIVIGGSGGNRIQSNQIGGRNAGNLGAGILLKNSNANQLGGETRMAGNVIVANQSHGVHFAGGESAANRVQNNFIGVDRVGQALGNGGDGVRFDTGARANLVGGEGTVVMLGMQLTVPMPNVIAHNQGAGVHVDGNLTVGNSILNNSITANVGQGILNSAGGNRQIQSPLGTLAANQVTQTVVNPAAIPAGSLIQVFSASDGLDPEGDEWIGEGTVQADGQWTVNINVPIPPGQPVTLTSTQPADGSTSEFGLVSRSDFEGGFRLERTDDRATESVPSSAKLAPILRLTATARTADVRVRALTFEASGSLVEPAQVTAVHFYRDTDGNGIVTDADERLAGPFVFTADNGGITLTNLSATVSAESSQRWLLVYSLSSNAPPGATFWIRLPSASSVDARFVHWSGLSAQAQGVFPIQSAEFVIGAPTARQTIGAWKQAKFSAAQLQDAQISGDTSDPDGDGVINLLEYAFNLKPLMSDRDSVIALGGSLPKAGRVSAFVPTVQRNEDFFAVTYVRRKAPVDLTYRVELSTDLSNWISEEQSPSSFATAGQTDLGDGMVLETVTVRSTTPMTGPGAPPSQFFRVRVQLGP